MTQYQFNDDVSWTRGNQTFKFGVTFKRDDTTDADPGINSQFPLANEFGPANSANADPTTLPLDTGDNFGSGNLLNATQAFPQRLSGPIAQYNFGVYAQDQWKITPQLPGDRRDSPGTQFQSRMPDQLLRTVRLRL